MFWSVSSGRLRFDVTRLALASCSHWRLIPRLSFIPRTQRCPASSAGCSLVALGCRQLAPADALCRADHIWPCSQWTDRRSVGATRPFASHLSISLSLSLFRTFGIAARSHPIPHFPQYTHIWRTDGWLTRAESIR